MIQDWEICVELNLDAFRREKRANREKIERADHGSRKFLVLPKNHKATSFI